MPTARWPDCARRRQVACPIKSVAASDDRDLCHEFLPCSVASNFSIVATPAKAGGKQSPSRYALRWRLPRRFTPNTTPCRCELSRHSRARGMINPIPSPKGPSGLEMGTLSTSLPAAGSLTSPRNPKRAPSLRPSDFGAGSGKRRIGIGLHPRKREPRAEVRDQQRLGSRPRFREGTLCAGMTTVPLMRGDTTSVSSRAGRTTAGMNSQ